MLLSQTVLGQLHKHCLSCWHATAATTSTPSYPILHMQKNTCQGAQNTKTTADTLAAGSAHTWITLQRA
jgi:hypothetical protein